MVYAIRLIILQVIWDVENTLLKAKISLLVVTKEIGKVKTKKSVDVRINHCVMTELGEIDSYKNPSKRKRQSDCSGLNVFSKRHINDRDGLAKGWVFNGDN